MNKHVTYFLTDEYYGKISDFANEVLERIDIEAEEIINDFIAFIKNFNVEKPKSRKEYKLEFLILIVLWKVYIDKALKTRSFPEYICILFYNIKHHFKIKSDYINNIIGKVKSRYLLKNDTNISKILYNRNDLKKLILWLRASGEFKYEAMSLNKWELFFKTNNDEYILKINKIAAKVFIWFQKASEEKLGKYTLNVRNFLKNSCNKINQNREDSILLRKEEIEYHLNMVGAEILNSVFNGEFIKASEKIVFLPSCMCLKQQNYCMKKITREGYICSECCGECSVKMITELGKKNGFKVFIVPHETDFISSYRNVEYGHVGIVGIACVLNLIEGGLKALNMKFVPQCVVLNYCGCKDHWHQSGIATDINNRKLLEILKLYV